jgi:hypothetical protein
MLYNSLYFIEVLLVPGGEPPTGRSPADFESAFPQMQRVAGDRSEAQQVVNLQAQWSLRS